MSSLLAIFVIEYRQGDSKPNNYMKYNTESQVEAYFSQLDKTYDDNAQQCHTRVLTTDNYVVLGQLTALRFMEWVCKNPGGVIALPTGKTPEFFIKWMQYYLDNWDYEMKDGLLGKLGFRERPDFKSLHFFQLDEFFPINPEHERSFRYFVKKYYIDVMGFDPEKTHLINTYFLNEKEQEMLGGAKNLGEVFVDGKIDLSLRIRKANTKEELIKQRAIHLFDEFCTRYENKIRNLGGIGFFLGGIGPDGHIAFNVRGSSPFSHTRLTGINYETRAAAAGDLGGIVLVNKKAVITMGLETITYNPDSVAVIIAAGQSKAKVVAGSVLNEPTQEFPATCLQKLPNARFFITKSAAVNLPKSHNYIAGNYSDTHDEAIIERVVIDACYKTGRTLQQLIDEHFENDELRFASKLSGESVQDVLMHTRQNIEGKVHNGLAVHEHEVILHTSPHHDDVELAYFPHLHHLVRSATIDNHFAYCTSGYTSVTSSYLRECYVNLIERIHPTSVAMRDEDVSTLFKTSYEDDITLYLRGIAQQNLRQQDYAVARRLARKWMDYSSYTNIDQLRNFVQSEIDTIDSIESGRKEPEYFHLAKGWLREFEAELVWAHFGIGTDHVNHLRLPFYSDDIFPHYPDFVNDVKPVLNLLERIKPTIVSLALDPEGSGPDTHFKTLIALSQAIDIYHENHPDIDLHVWGYRNVWSRFHISEVNTMIPISLNSFAVIKDMFNTCYLSQRSADFPSYEHEGPFSELAQIYWVKQHDDVCKLLGEDYLYHSDNIMLRRTYGFIYLKVMTYQEFHEYMSSVRRLLEVKNTIRDNK